MALTAEEKRAKKRAYMRRYRAINPEKVKAVKRVSYAKHKGEIKLRRAGYAAQHYAKHRARYKTVRAAYYAKNKEKVDQKNAAYGKTHREEGVLRATRYKAKKAGVSRNDFTVSQWRRMKKLYNYTCVYCGKKPPKLTQDHVIPLSKGGEHTFTNIVPACQPCNSKKRNGPPLVPVQPFLLL